MLVLMRCQVRRRPVPFPCTWTCCQSASSLLGTNRAHNALAAGKQGGPRPCRLVSACKPAWLGLARAKPGPCSLCFVCSLQWWRDAINDCYKGRPPAQPVITALAAVLQQAPLTRYRLQQVVATREADLLSAEQPASLAALEQYAEGTTGQLLALQLEAAGISPSSSSGSEGGGSAAAGAAEHATAAAEHAAAHLGKAVGLVGLLRGTYAHAAQRRVYLPADVCAAHGVGADDVLAGRDSPGMRDAVLAVAAAAKQHLDAAARLVGDAPRAARMLCAPGVAAGMYLSALEKAGFNLFDPAMLRKGGAVPPLAYQLRLKWALLRGSGF